MKTQGQKRFTPCAIEIHLLTTLVDDVDEERLGFGETQCAAQVFDFLQN